MKLVGCECIFFMYRIDDIWALGRRQVNEGDSLSLFDLYVSSHHALVADSIIHMLRR